MKYIQDPTGTVYGYDETDPAQEQAMLGKFYTNSLLNAGCTDVTGSWPPPPTAAELQQKLKDQALSALEITDMVAFRCFKAGISFPSTWQTYTLALRAIANGTDTTSTTLPTQPAYPKGT